MIDDTAIVREALTWFGSVALSSAKPLIRELGEGVLRDAGAALSRLTARLDAALSPQAGVDPTVALARFFAQNWTEGHIGQALNIIDMATRAGLVERDGMIRIELTDLGRAALALAEAQG